MKSIDTELFHVTREDAEAALLRFPEGLRGSFVVARMLARMAEEPL